MLVLINLVATLSILVVSILTILEVRSLFRLRWTDNPGYSIGKYAGRVLYTVSKMQGLDIWTCDVDGIKFRTRTAAKGWCERELTRRISETLTR